MNGVPAKLAVSAFCEPVRLRQRDPGHRERGRVDRVVVSAIADRAVPRIRVLPAEAARPAKVATAATATATAATTTAAAAAATATATAKPAATTTRSAARAAKSTTGSRPAVRSAKGARRHRAHERSGDVRIGHALRLHVADSSGKIVPIEHRQPVDLSLVPGHGNRIAGCCGHVSRGEVAYGRPRHAGVVAQVARCRVGRILSIALHIERRRPATIVGHCAPRAIRACARTPHARRTAWGPGGSRLGPSGAGRRRSGCCRFRCTWIRSRCRRGRYRGRRRRLLRLHARRQVGRKLQHLRHDCVRRCRRHLLDHRREAHQFRAHLIRARRHVHAEGAVDVRGRRIPLSRSGDRRHRSAGQRHAARLHHALNG